MRASESTSLFEGSLIKFLNGAGLTPAQVAEVIAEPPAKGKCAGKDGGKGGGGKWGYRGGDRRWGIGGGASSSSWQGNR